MELRQGIPVMASGYWRNGIIDMSPKPLCPLLAVSLLVVVSGCSHDLTNAELAQVYRTGMTRGEAANMLGKSMRVETRPADGWRQDETTAERVGAFASRFEQNHGAVVQACAIYWVPRGSFALGIWWDYLFFGPDDKLPDFTGGSSIDSGRAGDITSGCS